MRAVGRLLLVAACLAPASALKVLLFGANGNLGSKVLYQLAASGNEVTCFCRSEQRLRAGFNDPIFDGVAIIEGDAADRAAVDAAMAETAYDVCVTTAGYVDNGVRDAEEAKATPFCRIFSNIAGAAEQHLPAPRRALFIGGITALDLPGTSSPLQSLLNSLSPQYVAHLVNYERLVNSELDWTLFCPGYLVEEAPAGCLPSGCAAPDQPLRLSTDVVPIFSDAAFKPWQLRTPFKYLFVLLPFRSRMGQWTVPYESLAFTIADSLPAGGPFSRARVGLANQKGVKLQKTKVARKRERKARGRA